jgi:hypothetical protein
MQARFHDQLRRHPRAVGIAVVGGAVVLLAFAVGLAIAAFRAGLSTGEASLVPSASAIPSASSTSEVSPSSRPPGPTAAVIPYTADDALLQVSVAGLRMRATSSTGADILRSLDRGEVVRVMSGPVEADGYEWYEVIDLDSGSGWVAIGSGGEQWLEAVPAEPATSELLLRFRRDGGVSPRSESDIPVWPPDLTLTADGARPPRVVRQRCPSAQSIRLSPSAA